MGDYGPGSASGKPRAANTMAALSAMAMLMGVGGSTDLVRRSHGTGGNKRRRKRKAGKKNSGISR